MIHRKKLLASALLLGVGLASQGASATPVTPYTECPNIGASSSCSILFEFTSGGGINTYFDSNIGPYDGSDDVLVGVINNSSATVNSLGLTGYGNGGGIFAFDSDGLSTYTGTSYDPTGYAGPNITFSNISTTTVADDTGTVNFTGGLAAGASAYFSLESSPDSIQQGGTIAPTTPSVPEPGTVALFGLGLPVLGLMARRRKATA